MAIIKVDQTVCDICDSTLPTNRSCYACNKDICSNCCKIYYFKENLKIEINFICNIPDKLILCPICYKLINNKKIHELKRQIIQLIENSLNNIFSIKDSK